ncbi:MAG: ArsC/Spx/MgsR family protein [Pseudomonadota bacterium]
MTLKLYGIKNCDTLRKARKALQDADKDVEFIDVRADGLDAQTVKGWLDKVEADTLLNKRGTSWRALSDAEKAAAEADPTTAIVNAPTLFKRPVIVASDGGVTVGWKKPEQDKYLA